MSTTPETASTGPQTGSGTGPGTAAAEPDPKRWLALVVIAVTQLMIVLDASIVNIALPSAQRDLGISDADRSWAVTAYTLAFGGLLLLGGRIADYTGRKRTFIIGLLGFAFASAIGGLAQNGAMLFGARALQGAFAALMAPAALSLITVTFTESKERARAFGVFGAVAGGGAALGLVAGGVLTEYTSWRWCLLVNTPIAILTALAALPVVRESRSPGDRSYDIPGAALVTFGLVALVYGFTEAAKDDVGWSAASTIAWLTASVVLLVAFVLWEQRSPNPLLPLRIALDRNRGGSYLIFLLVGAGLFAMFLFLTFYFQVVLGYSALKSGFAFLPFSGGIIVTAGVIAQLLPRVGPKPLMIIGLVLATAGMLTLLWTTPTSGYATTVLPGQLMMSVGLAGVFIPASSTALYGIDSHDAGVASALLNTAQQVGGSLGLALLSTFYASGVTSYMTDNGLRPEQTPFGLQAPADALVYGYHVSYVWGAGLLALALLAAIVFITARKDDLPRDMAMAPV